MHSNPCPGTLNISSEVVKSLKEKNRLLGINNRGHKRYKTALIINEGMMWGAYSGGVVIGLEKMGMSDVFDYIIGISSGAATGAYFLSHQSRLGSSIYYEDLVGSRFINFIRFPKIMDLDYLEDIFRSKKILDTKKIKQSRSSFIIAVTEAKDGKGKLINVKDVDDIISLIKASMATPRLYNSSIVINNKKYIDGGIGVKIPLDYALNKLGCTDILIVSNKPCAIVCHGKTSAMKKSWYNIFYLALPHKLKPIIRKISIKNTRTWNLICDGTYKSRANISVMCFDNLKISKLTTDKSKLRNLVEVGRKDITKFFNHTDGQ